MCRRRLEIRSKGEAPASSYRSPGITLATTTASYGDVLPSAASALRPFRFSVPSSCSTTQAPMNLRLTDTYGDSWDLPFVIYVVVRSSISGRVSTPDGPAPAGAFVTCASGRFSYDAAVQPDGTYTNTDPWSKGGVMIRESLSPDSRHAQMIVSAASGLAFQRRLATAGPTSHTGATGAAPRWVRIRRAGNVFTAFASTDGIAWTQVGADTIPMGAAAYLGLAVASHNNAASATDAFDNLSATAP